MTIKLITVFLTSFLLFCKQRHEEPSVLHVGGGVDLGTVDFGYPVQKINVRVGNRQIECTSVSIAKNFLITAAHCVFDPNSQHIVNALAVDFHPCMAEVVNIFVHEKFDYSQVQKISVYDLALLEIRPALSAEDERLDRYPLQIKQIAVHAPSQGERLELIGFGKTAYGQRLGSMTPHLGINTIAKITDNFIQYQVPSSFKSIQPFKNLGSVNESFSLGGDSGGAVLVRGQLVGMIVGVRPANLEGIAINLNGSVAKNFLRKHIPLQ